MSRQVLLTGICISFIVTGCKGRSFDQSSAVPASITITSTQTIAGTFLNAIKTQRVDLNETTGTITNINPETGLIEGAHPTKIIVEWTSPTTARIFGVKNFATGEKDPTVCGEEISFDETKTTFVSPDNGKKCTDLFADKFYNKSTDDE